MNTQIFEQYESGVRSYCRHFPTVFTKAKGSIMTDENGREYIDFFCGAGALNYGHNNDYVKPKLIEYIQNDGIMHALDMYTLPKRDFIDFMQNKILKPRGLDYKIMFPAPTGTNAIEAGLKLARKVTGRNGIFAFMGCFHGMSLGALSLTSDATARKGAGVKLTDVTHIPAPYMFPELDTIEYMQKLIDDDHSAIEKPAAIVLETVQAEGGIWVFDNEYLQRLRAFCDKNDILLMIDDIQVGCARTGTYFSFERANIKPDIFVMSKSIGGYGTPFALTFFKPELDQWKPGEHNGTFRGNQLALVAAKAALEYMLEEKVEQQAKDKGEFIKSFVEKEILPLDSRLQLRGIGMVWGIEFEKLEKKGLAGRITEIAFDNDLIIECAGRCDSVVKIMPALVIEEELLLEGLKRLKKSIEIALAE